MSDPLVFDPRGAEQLKDFNTRMAAFCQDPATPVVNVVPSLSRQCLVLALAAPEDYPVPLYHALQPVVFTLTEADHLVLEATLARYRDETMQWFGKDLPIQHIQCFDIPAEYRGASPIIGYALFIAVVGEIADDADDEATAAALADAGVGPELGE